MSISELTPLLLFITSVAAIEFLILLIIRLTLKRVPKSDLKIQRLILNKFPSKDTKYMLKTIMIYHLFRDLIIINFLGGPLFIVINIIIIPQYQSLELWFYLYLGFSLLVWIDGLMGIFIRYTLIYITPTQIIYTNPIRHLFFPRSKVHVLKFDEINYLRFKIPKQIMIEKKSTKIRRYDGHEQKFLPKLRYTLVIEFCRRYRSQFQEILSLITESAKLEKHHILENIYFN